jgi:hypothetical protein
MESPRDCLAHRRQPEVTIGLGDSNDEGSKSVHSSYASAFFDVGVVVRNLGIAIAP